MLHNFDTFLKSLIVEALHPELQDVVTSTVGGRTRKQTLLAKKIKELTSRGEKTGIEGNMPHGSSRAYLKHDEPHHTVIDGKAAALRVGTKVAIRAPLDGHHNAKEHDGMSLGQLQNNAENNDWYLNKQYRILSKNDEGGYDTNEEHGIFPPLVDSDEKHNNWSLVGHARNIKSDEEFKKLTKCDSHPNGISHNDFCTALNREYERNNGKRWNDFPEREKRLDNISKHPLVEKFIHHTREYNAPPYDYGNMKNLGVFEHPNGSKHIVARDHGYDNTVMEAYTRANNRSIKCW